MLRIQDVSLIQAEQSVTINDLVEDVIGVISSKLHESDQYHFALTSKRNHLYILNQFKAEIRTYLAKYHLGKISFDSAFDNLPVSYVARLLSMLKQPSNLEQKSEKFWNWLKSKEVMSVTSHAFWQLAITIILRDYGCYYINSASSRMFNSDTLNPSSKRERESFTMKVNHDSQVEFIKEFYLALNSLQTEANFKMMNLWLRSSNDPNLREMQWLLFKSMAYLLEENMVSETLKAIIKSLKLGPEMPSLSAALSASLTRIVDGIFIINPWLAIYFTKRVSDTRLEGMREVVRLLFQSNLTVSNNALVSPVRMIIYLIDHYDEILNIVKNLSHPKTDFTILFEHFRVLAYKYDMNSNISIEDVLIVISNQGNFHDLMERISTYANSEVKDKSVLAELTRQHRVIHTIGLVAYLAHNNVPLIEVGKIAQYYIAAMNRILDVTNRKNKLFSKWEDALLAMITGCSDLGESVTQMFKIITLDERFEKINDSLFSSPIVIQACMRNLSNPSMYNDSSLKRVKFYLEVIERYLGVTNLHRLTVDMNKKIWSYLVKLKNQYNLAEHSKVFEELFAVEQSDVEDKMVPDNQAVNAASVATTGLFAKSNEKSNKKKRAADDDAREEVSPKRVKRKDGDDVTAATKPKK